MKISELIQKLKEKQDKHGDVVCEAWQHPEENEGFTEEINSLYFHEEKNILTIF